MLYVLLDLFIEELFFYKVILQHQYGNKFLWVETKIYPMGCPLLLYILEYGVTFSTEKLFSMHVIFTGGYYFVGHMFHLRK